MRYVIVIAVVLLSALPVDAQYLWLTNNEHRVFGPDSDYSPFGNDTLNGNVRSNDSIEIAGHTVFHEYVITSAGDFIHGPNYDPQFISPPAFNVPPMPFPPVATTLRDHADHYYQPGTDYQQRLDIEGRLGHLYTWPLGEAFDSVLAYQEPIAITDHTCIFTEAPLELKGIGVFGHVTVGSAKTIRLIDDVRVGGATSGPPQYRVDPTNTNVIGIVSEGDIKIGNTWANGRENSNGMGFGQNNQNATSIVITASIVALRSFTFEQQNDPDSGYVCECAPDWRGYVWLCGSVTQRNRGYMSRTNLGGTGYYLVLDYDTRLSRNNPPCFNGSIDSTQLSSDTLNFGNVVTGETKIDTAEVYISLYGTLGMANATPPFIAIPDIPQYGTHFIIPVSFTPPHVGAFSGLLQVTTSERYFEIILLGHGVLPNSAGGEFIPPPSSLIPSAYPNPFNAATTLSFELPSPGRVTAEVYDVTGRRVAELTHQSYSAGRHAVPFDGAAFASGLYFVQLSSPTQQRTLKLLLLK